jgi:cobalt/nickel transport system ATP-binding protein
MRTAALELRHVTVSRDPAGPPVLRDLTVSVAAGERVALVGLNGSGKTTLLLSVVGLVPHEGELIVDGFRVSPASLATVRARIGFVFSAPEDQLLFPRVLDDIGFGLTRRGVAAAEATARATAAAGALGIGHLVDADVHRLSHGQRQRVALAGALVTGPSLLLLDEPSAALDPPGRAALAHLLRSQPAAVLVATHDLEFASRFCGRMLVLEGGRITWDGPFAARPIAPSGLTM